MDNDALRPLRLEDYVGQDHIKEPLKAALVSAKHRGKPLAHTLLSGPPGLGKTTLSMIIAREVGWDLIDVIGPAIGNPKALGKTFLHMPGNAMFFIDEIHALRKPVQEILYPVLEDGRLLIKWSGGTTGEYKLKPLTVIGATTDLGKLTQPFIDRFQLNFELRFYETSELVLLGEKSAQKLGLEISADGMTEIAHRSRGTPRYTNNYLKWVRDFIIYQKVKPQVDADYVRMVLWDKLKIDDEGLRPIDRNYLRALKASGGKVGLESLASKMRQSVVTLENSVEPYLLYSGLVERARGGRILTDSGRQHLDRFRRHNA